MSSSSRVDQLKISEIVFRGASGGECEEFIGAIRQKAFAEGKQEDNKWIAQFASTCFSGKALRWHLRLDDKIQNDWKLLAQALIDAYPEDSEENSYEGLIPSQSDILMIADSTIPTPAAAPPRACYEMEASFTT